MTKCIRCDRPEDEHHEFDARVVPDGCVCGEGNWMDAIPPVCVAFKGEGDVFCETCEHDRECHAARPLGEAKR